jgi:Asp-tRNA(Asn)/Glu-tRNA(Gln) amidotransferase A subunit family amidase
MLGSKDVERMICELLDMGDEQLMAEMEESFLLSDEHHQRIRETLEEMVQEVDVLLLRMDEIEAESLNDEEKESNAR